MKYVEVFLRRLMEQENHSEATFPPSPPRYQVPLDRSKGNIEHKSTIPARKAASDALN